MNKEYIFVGNAQLKTRDYINNLKHENKELKDRINEAIKHIKAIDFQILNKNTYVYIKLDDLEQGKELLDILEGKDNEVDISNL